MIAVSPTDLDWFTQLRDDPEHAQVNFWTPTPWNVRQLRPGDRFYFLLKAPIRKIGGYGAFAAYENLTASRAWERFGPANGVRSLMELVARTNGYARRHSNQFELHEDPIIGCILLDNPVFLDDAEFLSPDEVRLSFPREVVKLKYFDLDIIAAIHPAPTATATTDRPFRLVDPAGKAYREVRVGDRPGQAAFRRAVLEAYGFRCAVTGESCREVLEAAHIQPHVNEASDDVRNGLALRTDLHRLFDAGLITVDPDYRFQVSNHLTSPQYRAYAGLRSVSRAIQASIRLWRRWISTGASSTAVDAPERPAADEIAAHGLVGLVPTGRAFAQAWGTPAGTATRAITSSASFS